MNTLFIIKVKISFSLAGHIAPLPLAVSTLEPIVVIKFQYLLTTCIFGIYSWSHT